MTTKYDKLDIMIRDRIAGGAKQFSAIFAAEVQAECLRLAALDGTRRSPHGVSPIRMCDRRLQALRRAGHIRFNGSGMGMGWEILGGRE